MILCNFDIQIVKLNYSDSFPWYLFDKGRISPPSGPPLLGKIIRLSLKDKDLILRPVATNSTETEVSYLS